jgi:hypothetical protein
LLLLLLNRCSKVSDDDEEEMVAILEPPPPPPLMTDSLSMELGVVGGCECCGAFDDSDGDPEALSWEGSSFISRSSRDPGLDILG